MTSEEFYKKEDCENNDKYDMSNGHEWLFGKEEMILFAEEYYKIKMSERQTENKRLAEDETRHNA